MAIWYNSVYLHYRLSDDYETVDVPKPLRHSLVDHKSPSPAPTDNLVQNTNFIQMQENPSYSVANNDRLHM